LQHFYFTCNDGLTVNTSSQLKTTAAAA